MGNYYFEDFTEERFRELLVLAKKKGYRFVHCDQLDANGRLIFWRHDVDYSIHRALRLAQIESEENIHATYFINLHSDFYNIHENEITHLIKKILNMNHDLGVHFDSAYYENNQVNIPLEEGLYWEGKIFKKTFGVTPVAVSFHNPDKYGTPDDAVISGMVNVYGGILKEGYAYCSDSNGYWRYQRLKSVLENAEAEKLHVLTHPEWWVPEVMSPRQRITRCIEGRAKKQHHNYDALLKAHSKKNVT